MKLIKLNICDAKQNILSSIEFKERNLVWSSKNAQGKTTLIRFLLHSMGYKVPSTKGMNMNNYITILVCKYKNIQFSIIRYGNEAKIEYKNKTTIDFDLNSKSDYRAFHFEVFNIRNPILIDNLLGAFYIDQEKGWSLINNGKTIGINNFDISNFISAITNCDTTKIDSEIEDKSFQIKKYQSIFNIVSLSEENKYAIKTNENLEELYSKKSNLYIALNEKQNLLFEINNIAKDNNQIIKLIESYNLLVKHNNEEFVLRKEDLVSFDPNNDILRSRQYSLSSQIYEIKKQLQRVNNEINKHSGLISTEDEGNKVIHDVNKINLNQSQLFKLINSLKREKRELSYRRNQMISHKIETINSLRTLISNFLDALEVRKYLDDEKDILFIKSSKAFSGATLRKIVFAYRLAYFIYLKQRMGIEVPLIIDSPGSGEMTIDNINALLDLIDKNVSDSQIIISSIYKDISFKFDKNIILDGGLLKNKNY